MVICRKLFFFAPVYYLETKISTMTYDNLEISLSDIASQPDVEILKKWLDELSQCRTQLTLDHPDAAKKTSEFCQTFEDLNEMVRQIRARIKDFNRQENERLRLEAKARREQHRTEVAQRETERKQQAKQEKELKQKQENSIPVVFMEAAKYILDKYTFNFILEEAKKAIEKRQNPNYKEEE